MKGVRGGGREWEGEGERVTKANPVKDRKMEVAIIRLGVMIAWDVDRQW